MNASVMSITPEMAKEMLANNKINRKLDRGRVAMYAADMKAGKWELNGEAIVFYCNGNLKDGQHRLNAIIESGIPVKMLVVTDVPNDSIIHDRGKIRTVANVLDLAGYESLAKSTQGVGTINFLYERLGPNARPTDYQIQSFLERYGDSVSTAVSVSRSGANHPICRKAPVSSAAFCALFNGVSEEKLLRFFKVANTGLAESSLESSAVILRNYIMTPSKYDSLAGSYGYYSKSRMFEVTLLAIKDYEDAKPRTKMYSTREATKYERYAKDNLFRDIVDT